MGEETIQLVCFDLDKTLVEGSSWKRLNLSLGVTLEEDTEMFNRHREGKLSYIDWQYELLDIYKEKGRADRKYIEEELYTFKYREGAASILSYLRDKEYILVLLSGAPDIVVQKVAEDLHFDRWMTNNTLIFDESDMLSDIEVLGRKNILS